MDQSNMLRKRLKALAALRAIQQISVPGANPNQEQALTSWASQIERSLTKLRRSFPSASPTANEVAAQQLDGIVDAIVNVLQQVLTLIENAASTTIDDVQQLLTDLLNLLSTSLPSILDM
ncbi:hypothetical protein ETC03_01150 [Geobacillus sp. MMMUD3]|nr:hypothetical protein [Geobacillus sp. MMMUD3]